jgi:cobaltochelatase CobT
MRNLMILAKWLAARAEVDVIEYNGTTACISLEPNGRRVIRIPSQWSYSNDPQAAELLEGVLDHEAIGHGRYTNLLGRSQAEKAGVIKFTALSAGIQNILEDIYIENMAIKTYPGVKANLARTVGILTERGFFGSPEKFLESEKSQLLTGGLLNILRYRLIPGQDVFLKENVEALEDLLPNVLGNLWDQIIAVAMEVEKSTSTEYNIELTVRIMKLIEDAAEQKPEDESGQGDPESGENQQSGDSNQDESEDEGESEGEANSPGKGKGGESQPGQPGDGQASGESESSSDEGGDAEGQGQGDKPGSESDTPTASKPGGGSGKGGPKKLVFDENSVEAAKEIMEAKDEETAQTEIGDAISEAIGSMSSGSDAIETNDHKSTVNQTVLNVSAKVKSVSDELQDALLAETRCEKSTKFVGKSLNSRVLSRVKLGNSRVFRQKIEGIGLSTAVTVLVDISGSMSDTMADGVTRLDAAIGLVYGLGDILDEFDVPFEINAYSDAFGTLKSFGDDWTQVRKRKEQPGFSGGTMTGAAMQKGLGNLVVRREERRLMIIITDGDTYDLDVLMSCYAESQAMGIEIASVMIGPKIKSIEALASKFGFKASSINQSGGLGRFAVERVLESV